MVAQERSRAPIAALGARADPGATGPTRPAARQLVQDECGAGNEASAKRLWQLAESGGAGGVEGLEEAVMGGILREEEPGGAAWAAIASPMT